MTSGMNPVMVHLMRHGAPQTPGLLLGHRDDPALDAETARCVARARGLEFAMVVSSDLLRTRTPAAVIAAERGAVHALDANWRELDFGQWTGLPVDQVDADAYARFWADPDANPPPDGESWGALCSRVCLALSNIREPALVLTHAGAIRATFVNLFHMEHSHTWAFDLPYASVVSLRIWPGDSAPAAAQIVGLAP